MAHRSVAQYGQYSAPMYNTRGLPPCVSGVAPASFFGTADAVPDPTFSKTDAGTDVAFFTTAAGAGLSLVDFDPDATTITATTPSSTMTPPTIQNARFTGACPRLGALYAGRLAPPFPRDFLLLLLTIVLSNGETAPGQRSQALPPNRAHT